MRGYEMHVAEGATRTAVVTKKYYTAQHHQINHNVENTLTELVPQTKTLQSLQILNVYSKPSDTLNGLDKFLTEVKSSMSKSSSWFNTPHIVLGCRATQKEGVDMQNVAKHY